MMTGNSPGFESSTATTFYPSSFSSTPDQEVSVAAASKWSLDLIWAVMSGWSNNTSGCDCSGHGECYNGTCVCEVQYDGAECREPNMPYFVAFASIFYVICAVTMLQLVCCIRAEFRRMKTPSLFKACRITTQKALYVLVFMASASRAFYFSMETTSLNWASNLLNAYYPIILTGFSLLVCFWAEVFHLQNIKWERPRFLSKSFFGFITFNVITYSVLIAEIVCKQYYTHSSEHDKIFFTHVFNSCYALLLFVVVIFFLIYGVEVYFKVHGGFSTTATGEVHQAGEPQRAEKLQVPPVLCGNTPQTKCYQTVDINQLHQSRLGLVSQACMMLIVTLFILSDILGNFWKNKVPVLSRNCHDVVFRVMELGVALWFPCVLWNCISPENLWILNPKKILKRLEIEKNVPKPEPDTDGEEEETGECWICYDTERKDAGPCIQPCSCKGDVSWVHHECLRRWLVESSETREVMKCSVCGDMYQLAAVNLGAKILGAGWTSVSGLKVFCIVGLMCASAAGAWIIFQSYTRTEIRLIAGGGAVLFWYMSLRFLGVSFVKIYKRARVSAVQILGKPQNQQISSISETVMLEIQTHPTIIPAARV